MKKEILLFYLFLTIVSAQAQEKPCQEGEMLHYDIRYKYGLVMLKAGVADYSVKGEYYRQDYAFKIALSFKTSSFFDRIYKIRDTLNSYLHNENLEPLYHIRKIHEGDTHFWEELFFSVHSSQYSEARVIRSNSMGVKFDTIIFSNNAGYDLLSVFIFARTLDYSNLAKGKTFNISSFVGKDKVNIIARYDGQTVVEKSEKLKYNAHKLAIDIADNAFKESKNAMEIWISDDMNRIPLKLKAKLAIGAAEVDLASYQNLKYPFVSEIRIPNR
jgi:hypothetical protein